MPKDAAAVVAATLVPACAGSQLRIETSPEGAEVAWVRPGQSPQSLGKTPLRLSGSEAADFASRGGQLQAPGLVDAASPHRLAPVQCHPQPLLEPRGEGIGGRRHRTGIKPAPA
jgi:hypothetical protein